MSESDFYTVNHRYEAQGAPRGWPTWELQAHGSAAPAPGSAAPDATAGSDGRGCPPPRLDPLGAWCSARLTFADGARIDVLVTVSDEHITVEDVRADPPLTLDGLADLGRWIEGPLDDAFRAATGRPRKARSAPRQPGPAATSPERAGGPMAGTTRKPPADPTHEPTAGATAKGAAEAAASVTPAEPLSPAAPATPVAPGTPDPVAGVTAEPVCGVTPEPVVGPVLESSGGTAGAGATGAGTEAAAAAKDATGDRAGTTGAGAEASAEAAEGAAQPASEEPAAGEAPVVEAPVVEPAPGEPVAEEPPQEKVTEERPRSALLARSRSAERRKRAADAYREAQREGRDPVLAVMLATGRNRRRSLRLIAGARDEGLLTPRHNKR